MWFSEEHWLYLGKLHALIKLEPSMNTWKIPKPGMEAYLLEKEFYQWWIDKKFV